MSTAHRPVIFLATANPSRKKKGTQRLKDLFENVSAVTSSFGDKIQVAQEGKDGEPQGFVLLGETYPHENLEILHLASEPTKGNPLFMNASAGRRKALELEAINFDHLQNLKLALIDGGATSELVEAMLFAGVPAVIGLQSEANKDACQNFLTQLYQSLLSGKPLSESIEKARTGNEELFHQIQIPSDPYDYWQFKEAQGENSVFKNGLYLLSANASILNWQLLEASEEVIVEEEVKPIPEKEVVVVKEVEKELPSALFGIPLIEEPQKEEKKEEPASIPAKEEKIILPQPIEVEEEPENPVHAEIEPETIEDVPLEIVEDQSIPETIISQKEEVKEPAVTEEPILKKKEEAKKDEPNEELPYTEPIVPQKRELIIPDPTKVFSKDMKKKDLGKSLADVRTKETMTIIRKSSAWIIQDGNQKETLVEEAKSRTESEPSFKSSPDFSEPHDQAKEEYEPAYSEYDSYYQRDTNYSPPTNGYAPNWKAVAGIGSGILACLIAIWVMTQQTSFMTFSNDEPTYISLFESPETYNILLLPFRPYAHCDAEDAYDETGVRDRLNTLEESKDLGLRVSFLDQGTCPGSVEEARRIGELYRANLVIWGNYLKTDEDQEIMYLNYIALNKDFERVSISLGNIGKQAFGDLYDLQEGQFVGKLDDIVYWVLGVVLLQNEEYASAINYVNQIAAYEDPEYGIIHHILAKCNLGLNQFDAAISEYNKAIMLNPRDANAYHNRGRTYQKLRQNDQALADFGEAIRINPKHLKAHYHRKLILDGEFEDGFEVESIMDDEPPMATVEDELVINPELEIRELGQAPREVAAISVPNTTSRQPVERMPEKKVVATPQPVEPAPSDEVQVHLRKGYQAELEGNLKDALASYTKAIELNPNAANPYFSRAILYENMGKYKNALTDYQEAIRRNSSNKDFYSSRADLYERMKQYYRAISDYSEIIKIDPQAIQAFLYRGKAYQYVKRNEAALADFHKAIRLNPNNATGYYFRSRLYGEINQPDKALQDLNKAIEINPGYASAYRDRGELYKSQKKYKEALADFTKISQMNPSDAKVYAVRGEILLRMGQYQDAENNLKQAIRLDPKNQNYQELLALITRER